MVLQLAISCEWRGPHDKIGANWLNNPSTD